jgi:hypothetical protein
MVRHSKSLCGLMNNTIVPLLMMMTSDDAFNAAKESLVVWCSTVSTKVSSSSLSVSSMYHKISAAVK